MKKDLSSEYVFVDARTGESFHQGDTLPSREKQQQVPQTFVLACSKTGGNEVCAVRFASTKTFKEFQSSFPGKGFNFGPIYDRLVAQGLVKSNCSKQIADANPRLITQNPGAEKFWGWGDGFTPEIIENTFITVPAECVARESTNTAQTVDKKVASTPARLDTVAAQPSHVDPVATVAKANETSTSADYITAGIIGGAAVIGVAGAIVKNRLDERARQRKAFEEETQQQLMKQTETSARLNAEAAERERIAEERRKKKAEEDVALKKKIIKTGKRLSGAIVEEALRQDPIVDKAFSDLRAVGIDPKKASRKVLFEALNNAASRQSKENKEEALILAERSGFITEKELLDRLSEKGKALFETMRNIIPHEKPASPSRKSGSSSSSESTSAEPVDDKVLTNLFADPEK